MNFIRQDAPRGCHHRAESRDVRPAGTQGAAESESREAALLEKDAHARVRRRPCQGTITLDKATADHEWPVTLITAAYKDASASCRLMVIREPQALLVAVAINPSAFTHELIDKSNELTINIQR